LSQWRGYCPPAFGYSVGFDGERLRKIVAPQGFRLNKCIYDHPTQQAMADGWAQKTVALLLQDLPATGELSNYVRSKFGPFLGEFVDFAPFLKHSAFKDEQEWRLVGLLTRQSNRF
jgi:hypothetical protein